jgi:glycosyltransferase involved in cell wall biosynthesis
MISKVLKNIRGRVGPFLRQKAPNFLVLVPIHRSPELLPYALKSILAQSEQSFAVHIICDGAPDETAVEALRWAKDYKQISTHVMPKGQRHGEAHRDHVIKNSNAEFVCQLADDDIWFPNHLSTMKDLLEEVDFGHTRQLLISPPLVLSFNTNSLSMPHIRKKFTKDRFNLFGPTAAGYRRDAYLRLQTGWSPAPEGIWTDLFMWRKFLNDSSIRSGSTQKFTNFHPAASAFCETLIADKKALNAKLLRLTENPDELNKLKSRLHSECKDAEAHPNHVTADNQNRSASVKLDFLDVIPQFHDL